MHIISGKGVKIYREYYLNTDIMQFPMPKTVKIPTAYGGKGVIWKKTIGDRIEKYEIIAYLKNDIPVYANFSGYLKDIIFASNLGGINGMQYAVIETEKDDIPTYPLWSSENLSGKELLLDAVKKSAIIDELRKDFLFNTLNKNATYKKLLIDAVDDEPYQLSRTAVLCTYLNEVVKGAQIIADFMNIPEKQLLMHKNFCTKKLFSEKIDGIKQVKMCGKYPALPAIKKYTSKENALRIGAESCRAVYRAVYFSEPQLSNTVTVWGDGVNSPMNIEMPIGTCVNDILDFCNAGGMLERVVAGGVMTGYAASVDYPLYRWDESLTAMAFKKHHKTVECLNCGRCALVCPLGLAPYYILRTSKYKGVMRAKQICAETCNYCGACSYICPARIPLGEKIKEFSERGGEKT